MKKLIVMLGLVIFGVMGCADSKFPKTAQYTKKAKPEISRTDFEPVYIDANFNADEKTAIVESISDLNTVLNGYYTYFVVSDKLDASSVITDDEDAEPSDQIKDILSAHQGIIFLDLNNRKMLDQVDDGVLAFTLPEVGVVFVMPSRIGYRDMHAVLLHEAVHTLAWGTNHVPVKGTLMYPSYHNNYATCITYLDMLAISTSLNLPAKDLNYCGELPKE